MNALLQDHVAGIAAPEPADGLLADDQCNGSIGNQPVAASAVRTEAGQAGAVRITIPGTPVAKGRPRFTLIVPTLAKCASMMVERAGRGPFKPGHLHSIIKSIRPRAFTPEKTRVWESECAIRAMARMRSRPPMSGPVSVLIIAEFAPAPSWPAWKRDAAIGKRIAPTTKPDGDNIAKAAVDALNGIVIDDDCQIVETTHRKRYARNPGVTILVTPLDMSPAQITRRTELA